MAPRRLRPIDRPVRVAFDGAEVEAAQGEPLAVSLYAAGHKVLGRSTKYHRPRGAYCFRGRCDGCLTRVDGRPNVMSCAEPASADRNVEVQNVLGSASHDLLGVTDWFFPRGLDHHHIFTRYKVTNRVMQGVARRLAGIGRLPEQILAPTPVRSMSTDVLVVGGGAPGLIAARACAEAGTRTVLVEEQEELGGSLLDWPEGSEHPSGVASTRAAARDLVDAAASAGVSLLCAHAAVGVYRDGAAMEVVHDTREGLVRIRPKHIILATGRHDGMIPFAGGDMPGVISARGSARLLRHDVAAGACVAFIGESVWERAMRSAFGRLGVATVGPFAAEVVVCAEGGTHVERLRVRAEGEREEPHACDAVAVSAPPTAAHELAGQAGVGARFVEGGFVVDADPADGATRVPRVHVIGSASGVIDLAAQAAQAAAAGRAAASVR